jgi:hypothetical protein
MRDVVTHLEVLPQRSGWVVVEGRGSEPLSQHPTADAAVRAAQSVLARETSGELIVRDRYARMVSVAVPRRQR